MIHIKITCFENVGRMHVFGCNQKSVAKHYVLVYFIIYVTIILYLANSSLVPIMFIDT
jgi:hypothetical protein